MRETGWTGEAPDAAPMPLTAAVMSIKSSEPGDAMAIAMARSAAADVRDERERAARATDPDEYAANLVTRGYMPGAMSQLALRLADVEAQREEELAKIERGKQRQERVMRMHQRGQVGAWQIQEMLGDDDGDARRAEMLERRAARIRQEMADAAQAMAPPERRQMDMAEQATSRAQQILAGLGGESRRLRSEGEVRPAGRRPFGSGGLAVRSEPVPACPECRKVGATPDESFLLHSDPDPVPVPAGAADDGQGNYADRAAWPVSYDRYGREITRGEISRATDAGIVIR